MRLSSNELVLIYIGRLCVCQTRDGDSLSVTSRQATVRSRQSQLNCHCHQSLGLAGKLTLQLISYQSSIVPFAVAAMLLKNRFDLVSTLDKRLDTSRDANGLVKINGLNAVRDLNFSTI